MGFTFSLFSLPVAILGVTAREMFELFACHDLCLTFFIFLLLCLLSEADDASEVLLCQKVGTS